MKTQHKFHNALFTLLLLFLLSALAFCNASYAKKSARDACLSREGACFDMKIDDQNVVELAHDGPPIYYRNINYYPLISGKVWTVEKFIKPSPTLYFQENQYSKAWLGDNICYDVSVQELIPPVSKRQVFNYILQDQQQDCHQDQLKLENFIVHFGKAFNYPTLPEKKRYKLNITARGSKNWDRKTILVTVPEQPKNSQTD